MKVTGVCKKSGTIVPEKFTKSTECMLQKYFKGMHLHELTIFPLKSMITLIKECVNLQFKIISADGTNIPHCKKCACTHYHNI